MKSLILAAGICAAGCLAYNAPVQAGRAVVTIDNFKFAPETLTVAAGTSVRFVNRDDEAHTVTATAGTFDSGGLDRGDAWTYRFTKPGRYAYFCTLHPWMKGTVVVTAGGPR